MPQGPPPDAARKGARARPGEHGQFVGSSSFLGHTLPEGTKIGGLEITGLIGEGGFGIVYLAYDASLQRVFARGLDAPPVQPEVPDSAAFRDWMFGQSAVRDWDALFDYRQRAPAGRSMSR